MPSLLVRLAGPLQSWGAEPRDRVVTTRPSPTWSGLLGLCRAALGHGRDDDPAQVAWLRKLTMAVRIDQPGQARLDYHTINPLPDAYRRFRHVDTFRDLAQVTIGQQAATGGKSPAWVVKGKLSTLVTQRGYLHDAAFLWFVEGPPSDLTRLAYALTHPVWALYLGRKSCPAATPLVLGMRAEPAALAALRTPVLRPARRSSRGTPDLPERAVLGLTWLTPPPPDTPAGTTIPVMDNPLGSHPQHGHTHNLHTRCQVTAPILYGPWDVLLDWAAGNLTRPDLETQP